MTSLSLTSNSPPKWETCTSLLRPHKVIQLPNLMSFAHAVSVIFALMKKLVWKKDNLRRSSRVPESSLCCVWDLTKIWVQSMQESKQAVGGCFPSMLPLHPDESNHEEGSPQKRLHPPHGRWRNIRLVGQRGKKQGSWKPPHIPLFLSRKHTGLLHAMFWVDSLGPSVALPSFWSSVSEYISLHSFISQVVQNIRNERGAGHQVLPNPNKKMIKQQNEKQRKVIGSVLYGKERGPVSCWPWVVQAQGQLPALSQHERTREIKHPSPIESSVMQSCQLRNDSKGRTRVMQNLWQKDWVSFKSI